MNWLRSILRWMFKPSPNVTTLEWWKVWKAYKDAEYKSGRNPYR